jgi:type I restriction enzyme S subunit
MAGEAVLRGKYVSYPEYNMSGTDCWFDRVPSHWQIKRISYIALLKSGDSIVSEQIKSEGHYPVYGGNGRRGYTKNFNHDGNYILIGRQGALCGNINYGHGKFWASEHAVVVYPTVDINFKWFGETLRAMDLNQYNVSAAQPGLAVGNITCLKIPFPSVEEQQEIANFLDHETAKIDTLIEKQQQLIALLKEKRQAVISHAVTKGLNASAPMRDSGVEWLGEVPEHWEVKKFTHCATIRNGQVDPTKEPYCNFTLVAPNHIESGTGRLIMQETAAEQGADSGKYLCKKGEVIYSKIRPALAKVCISPSNNTICSADMYPIQRMLGLTNEFLFWSLLSTWFTSLVILESDRVAMPKINREKLAEVMLPVPPENEQKEIGAEINRKTEAMDSLVLKSENAIALAKERRTALISAAVTGKIDVRNWQLDEKEAKE